LRPERVLHPNGSVATAVGQVLAVDRLDARGDRRLHDCYVAPVARCAPPANKPTPQEVARCRDYLAREWALLREVRGVLVLGRIALDGFLAMLRETGRDVPRGLAFGHGAVHDLGGGVRLFCSFHVSQQNTFTGRLTPRSFDAVLRKVKAHLGSASEEP
jgi:uracil-DNA glycosylase family 4